MKPASPDAPEPRDAYLRWFLQTRLPAFRTRKRTSDVASVGLIVEWTSLRDAAVGSRLLNDLKVQVPRIDAGPPPLRRIWVISVARDVLPRLLDAVAPHVRRVELASPIFDERGPFRDAVVPHGGRVELASPTVDERGPFREAARPRRSTGRVLTAVLDDGCAFANQRFRDAGGGTRVVWLWDQDADGPGRPLDTVAGPSPTADFLYGRQWSKADLDVLIAAVPGGDEGAVYEALGTRALRRSVMHGPHVMDLFVGGTGVDTVFVQFPATGIDDPTGRWLARYALDGLHYVLECAGPEVEKIVVNISWGPQTGPHDGSSLLEVAIDELVAEQRALKRELVVCLPSGNSFGARAHGCVDAATGGTLTWTVPPDGEDAAFLEIWWPKGAAPANIRLRITPPGGVPAAFGPAGDDLGDARWHANLGRPAGQGAMVLLVVNPTGGHGRPAGARGQSGAWTLEFDAHPPAAEGAIHLYVARADHNMGARRRSRASHFADPPLAAARFRAAAFRDAEAPDSLVRRAGTLNGMATGASTWVASGYALQDFSHARYSSTGPARGAAKVPAFAFVTDRSRLRQGVAASGVRSGTKAVLVGTSTAAPQMARQLGAGEVAVYEPTPRPALLPDGEFRAWPDDALIHPA